jgi:hypothetical protein
MRRLSTTTPDRAGDHLLVTVSDNGVGMSPEVRKGTGLGLSTAYAIVERHHGWLDCRSTVGQGTEFRLFLPLLATETDPSLTGDTESREDEYRGTETVLLIDDEQVVRSSVARALRQHGYEVLEADDGQSGLSAYRSHAAQIGIIILDESMPRMSGSELIAQIRSEGAVVPVVLMTGLGGLVEPFPGTRILHKPFTMREFSKALREELEKVV